MRLVANLSVYMNYHISVSELSRSSSMTLECFWQILNIVVRALASELMPLQCWYESLSAPGAKFSVFRSRNATSSDVSGVKSMGVASGLTFCERSPRGAECSSSGQKAFITSLYEKEHIVGLSPEIALTALLRLRRYSLWISR